MNTTLFNLLAEVKGPSTWFPTDASASNQVDGLFYFIYWVCAFFLVFNAGLMVFFAIRYRQKSKAGTATGHTHNTALEVTWSVIPAFILAIIFIWGFRGFLVMAEPPSDAYDITVTGKKWNWAFTYPNGETVKSEKDPVTSADLSPALHVPSGRPVRLTLVSEDVIHSVFIPQLRVKKDVVPGRYNQLWFEANFDPENAEPHTVTDPQGNQHEVMRNEYDLFCAEYCGQDHSRMVTKVYVYEQADFEKWYVGMSVIPDATPLVDVGKTIWAVQCSSCHSIDGGNTANYPTWLDLYGQPSHGTNKGGITVDDAYIHESIRNPGAVLVHKPNGSPYPNQMAAFTTLSEREIRGVIEFMKSISTHAKDEFDPDLIYGDLNADGTLKSESGEGETEGETEGEPEAGDDAGAAPGPAPEAIN